MKYISTRGQAPASTFSEVLLSGLAPDGGLYVPETLPSVSTETLQKWRELSYPDLAFEVLSLFITDIPADDLRELCRKTYTAQAFGSEDIVPIKPLPQLDLKLVGLSEGPTLAFKDIAMQFLGNIFEYVLLKNKQQVNILGATSGDTGSAAEYALKGKHNINVFMLSPHNRMSDFQRAQMYTLDDDNVFNIAIKGVFDDCQDIVKALAGDADFKKQYHIGAVNSINFARIAAQVVYYFWAWAQVTDSVDEKVSFAVPSGNFGNILAGHYARMMGLPISRLILATNENNVLEEFFNTGRYKPRSSADTHATSSPSMDISKASNFERFVFDLLGRDTGKFNSGWSKLAEIGELELSELKSLFAERYGFYAGASTHQNRVETIKECHDKTGVLIDPHTADGVFVARQFIEPGIPMLVLETALPIKFGATVAEAIGHEPEIPAPLQGLLSKPQKIDVLDADAGQVRAYIQKQLGV